MGEKEHWEKFVLYEKATRIPLIIVAPGHTVGQVCQRPVSLIDLYPTLTELCKLPGPTHLEGESLVPLLRKPKSKRDPVLITYGKGNHAVRSEQYRYIRYANGEQELYDLENDPNEWSNIAYLDGKKRVIKQHAKWMPLENVNEIGPAN